MKKFLEPQRRYEEQMKKFLEPQRRYEEQMKKFLEPQRRYEEQMKKFLEPQRRYEEQMKKFREPQRRYEEQMKKFLEPQRRFEEQMKKFLEPQRRYEEQIKKFLRPLNNYLSEPEMGTFTIDPNGVITVNNETVEVDMVTESIASITDQIANGDNFLDQFFEGIGKLKTALRIAIVYLILPYFLSIIANLTTPLFEEWWKDHYSTDKRVAKKELGQLAANYYDDNELSKYRFVNTKILHVRLNKSTHSRKVGVLTFGKIIRVLEKSRSWSLIEYQDNEYFEVRRGWVFSRYISKFKK